MEMGKLFSKVVLNSKARGKMTEQLDKDKCFMQMEINFKAITETRRKTEEEFTNSVVEQFLMESLKTINSMDKEDLNIKMEIIMMESS